MTPVLARDVDELVSRFVRVGDHLHLAATQSRPNALTYALCRVFGDTGRFTVSTTAIHSSAHALTLSGSVDRVIAGFVGDTYPSPRPNPLYARLAEGDPFTLEAWSLLSYVQRLAAGATGAPYAVTGSLADSDLAVGKGPNLYRVPDPAAPQRSITLIRALRPDLTLVHGACGDDSGNIVLYPPLGEGTHAAFAAERGVIASVERIVPTGQLRGLADRVVIPGQRVLGMCVAELGAHPQSLRDRGGRGYLEDYEFIEEIVDRCAAAECGRDWYREWVVEPGSHAGYLAKLGQARRSGLRWDDAAPSRLPTARGASEESATDHERLIVLGARTVADRVRSGGYDTVLAGIGSSHMAAWLAAELLKRDGHTVHVTAELGAYGFVPEAGDVFLFSLRHAATAEALAGVAEMLGGMVAANSRALGVLGAAEIDQTGAINTSLSATGRWLTGSGGANDIASSADCVVIASASRRRFVREVRYRTSPGDRVVEVTSQFGRFTRSSPAAAFHLASWLPDDAENVPVDPDALAACAAERVARDTAWQVTTADVAVEKPITTEELAALRHLDPDGRYR